MRFIPHTDDDVRGMLAAIGAPSVRSLFECVPEKLRLGRPLALPEAGSEQEVLAELAELAGRNAHTGSHAWFLGAGSYAHFVPAAVDALASRGEFYTAYTPYQAEISQGTLQAIFEWQTMMAGLTGLEVSNASLYDGASATAEAALMALRITRRRKVAVSAGLHPHYRAVLATYLGGLDAELVELPLGEAGTTASAAGRVDADTACVIVQQPNFFGCVEELAAQGAAAAAGGALLVSVTTEALSLALLRAPGACGADIACGEAQSFGVPLGFGGPHLGFLCTRSRYVRQMPGRLVGATEDARGRRGFVLTLSTREQHIRRERATSNICTNQGLCLLMATIYLALLGRRGLRGLAELNLAKASYAKARLARAGLRALFPAPSFNEFAVGLRGDAGDALARAREAGIVAGLDLAPYAPQLGPALLVCATELVSREQIDRLADSLGAGGRA
jgi:glycine dehydrogenase subunit 1